MLWNLALGLIRVLSQWHLWQLLGVDRNCNRGKYLDCLAGAGTLALGHNHASIRGLLFTGTAYRMGQFCVCAYFFES
ncbi:hypothetical protein E4653_00245 [Corynebacterium diphtheriae subsp. lausannense]|nr:hypothetical protein E4653_00245 [Corynebacterium diphtheriae subsp. lausannense]